MFPQPLPRRGARFGRNQSAGVPAAAQDALNFLRSVRPFWLTHFGLISHYVKFTVSF
jgi:hypothetical protein